jgi:hypothetical protein
LDFFTLFGVTIKNTWAWGYGKKNCIMSLNACIVSQVSHNFMKHCSCSVMLPLIFSFSLSFLSFSPFLAARAFFMIFFWA